MRTLTLALLLAFHAQSKPKDVAEACGIKKKESLRTLAIMQYDITSLETDPSSYNPVKALGYRRQLQMLGMPCYRYLQEVMGLGKSPITGE